ncbi:Crp/Fnr family transcriptional regulator [Candidatus Formimonas warabiya]|uniref:Crp/Fnr family transcriptional regulator n=1 Tax=Formimonas warabiya TaxID=1761012 RepID=A0A3G1KUU3_FORW1|nr:Crp/Fnr family transcriptional regulator [Candidatus Formimonas warabiya]ATW26212.1 hypothetical protein DCMF_16850 [Candidatus Formimonas warabiya]
MLREFKLFADLPPEAYKKILPFFKKRNFAKKQQVEFADSFRDYVFFMKSGRVKVSYFSPEGKEIIVTILHPGDMYSMHSEATLAVIEPAEIWYLGLKDFKKILLDNPELALVLIKILGAILKNTNEALLNLAFKEVNSRLAGWLLKMAKEQGLAHRDGTVIELNLTHEEIGYLIGSTRQTVTTILNRFERAGILSLQKKRIIVHRIEELEELC